jgi:transposase
MLPHDFPHWRTVYGYFRQWIGDGTWEQLQDALRESAHQASMQSEKQATSYP